MPWALSRTICFAGHGNQVLKLEQSAPMNLPASEDFVRPLPVCAHGLPVHSYH
jgi:hypothetical protein